MTDRLEDHLVKLCASALAPDDVLHLAGAAANLKSVAAAEQLQDRIEKSISWCETSSSFVGRITVAQVATLAQARACVEGVLNA